MKAGMFQFPETLTLKSWSQYMLSLEFLYVLLWVSSGLVCYGIALLAWMRVLAHMELSIAYPILSLGYILVYLGAAYWPRLAEPANDYKTLGTLLIIFGVILITSGKKRA